MTSKLFTNESLFISNTPIEKKNITTFAKVELIISLIAPFLLFVYLIFFIPIFSEYYKLNFIQEWQDYLLKYSQYAYYLLSASAGICIFSFISMVISSVTGRTRLGIMNFLTFIIGISVLFLTIIALTPD